MGILSKIFKNDGSITFYQLRKNLVYWKSSGVYPANYSLPKGIKFSSDFWSQIIDLYKYTRKDGYERAISVFWVDGEVVLTSVVKGSKKSVKTKSGVKVAYQPIKRNNKYDYYWRKIWVNDKIYSKKKVYKSKVPKKIEKPVYLFNMHTHPPHEKSAGRYSNYDLQEKRFGGDYRGQKSYSYWSAQDIKSLIKSSAIVTGVITDRLNLLIRTNETPGNVDFLKDSDVSRKYLSEELNLGVYEGDFKKTLWRWAVSSEDSDDS